MMQLHANAPEKEAEMAVVLGPCHSEGRLRLAGLLALGWPTLGHCSHLGGDHQLKISVSPPLLCNCAFHINKSEGKKNDTDESMINALIFTTIF